MKNLKLKPTKQDRKIFKLYDKGWTDKQIAKHLGLPRPSVRATKAWRTMEKYDLKSTRLKTNSHGSKLARKPTRRYRERPDKKVIEDLFSDDISANTTKAKRKVVRNILERNTRAVAPLKLLYRGECQLTGTKYAFKKTDGRLYSEAHHLTPLGEGGADSPHNLVIISPLIHRMFHYAKVSSLDLRRIVGNKLKLKINGKNYIITWHPKHAEAVASARTAKKV
jgi:hypothetical protein